MQTLVERGCGLDVHQATVVACLLMVGKSGKVQKQIRTFGTATRELLSCASGCSPKAVAMWRWKAQAFIGNLFMPFWKGRFRSWWPTRNTLRRFLDARPM